MTMPENAFSTAGAQPPSLSFLHGGWARRLLPHLILFLLALLIGSAATYITYPGIWYSDSYWRAEIAQMILQGYKPLPAFLSLPMQFVIAFFLRFTGGYVAYTLAQAVFFLWTVLEAAYLLFPGRRFMVYGVLALLSPLFIGYSVYWESNVVAAAALLWLAILQLRDAPRGKRGILYYLLYAVLCWLLIGYRYNSLTALCGLLAFGAFRVLRKQQSLRQLCLQIAVAALALCHVVALSRSCSNEPGNAYVGPYWETARMIHYIGPGQGYDTYLDELLGEGGTLAVFNVTDKGSMYDYSSLLDYWNVFSGKDSIVYRKYLRLILERPDAFWQIRSEHVLRVMRTLAFSEYDYDRLGRMHEFAMRDTPARQYFYRTVVAYMRAAVVLRTPWILYLLAAVLVCVCAVRRLPSVPGGSFLWFSACFYGAFLLTAQTFGLIVIRN